jgi:hypothetical protein
MVVLEYNWIMIIDTYMRQRFLESSLLGVMQLRSSKH